MNEQIKTISYIVIALSVVIYVVSEFTGGKDDNSVPERLAPPLREELQPKIINTDDPKQMPERKENTGETTIFFEQTEVNIGDLKKGEKKNVSFKFQNTGGAALQVGDIAADFGVNVVSYSQEKVEPGQSGSITVEFDSKILEPGVQNKIVHVNTTANPNHVHLQVTGNVTQ